MKSIGICLKVCEFFDALIFSIENCFLVAAPVSSRASRASARNQQPEPDHKVELVVIKQEVDPDDSYPDFQTADSPLPEPEPEIKVEQEPDPKKETKKSAKPKTKKSRSTLKCSFCERTFKLAQHKIQHEFYVRTLTS
jgi:outer membrane biosynthesis protein TonB